MSMTLTYWEHCEVERKIADYRSSSKRNEEIAKTLTIEKDELEENVTNLQASSDYFQKQYRKVQKEESAHREEVCLQIIANSQSSYVHYVACFWQDVLRILQKFSSNVPISTSIFFEPDPQAECQVCCWEWCWQLRYFRQTWEHLLKFCNSLSHNCWKSAKRHVCSNCLRW